MLVRLICSRTKEYDELGHIYECRILKMFFFFFGTFISFLNPPSEWLQNFALTIAFSLGSNSILREDPSSPMACFCATNLFLLSFGVSLWTGEAAGFCASVFETQQGEYRLQFLCLHFFAGSCWKTLNPLTADWALRALIDFTLSNARRFYSSMGNPLDGKGLTTVS